MASVDKEKLKAFLITKAREENPSFSASALTDHMKINLSEKEKQQLAKIKFESMAPVAHPPEAWPLELRHHLEQGHLLPSSGLMLTDWETISHLKEKYFTALKGLKSENRIPFDEALLREVPDLLADVAPTDARGSESKQGVDKDSYGYKAQVLMCLIKRAENQLRQFAGQWVICKGPLDPPQWAKEVATGKGRALHGRGLTNLEERTWPCSSSPVTNFCMDFFERYTEEGLLRQVESDRLPPQSDIRFNHFAPYFENKGADPQPSESEGWHWERHSRTHGFVSLCALSGKGTNKHFTLKYLWP